MRPFGLGLVLLVPLAACFTPNRVFELATDSTDSSDTTATDPATTIATDPTTTTTTTTTTTATTTATEPTATATSEPLTSTSTSTDDTGTPDLPQQCVLIQPTDQARYLHQAIAGEPKVDPCGDAEVLHGWLKMTGTGDLRLRESDDKCTLQGEPATHILGKGWPDPVERDYSCVKATIVWNKTDGTCQIGTLLIEEANKDKPKTLYMASLSYSGPNSDLALSPIHLMNEPCGCAGDPPCCLPDDAGGYSLEVLGIHVPAGEEVSIKFKSAEYRFLNIQSHVGPGCQQNPPTDIHFDWFAERTQ